MSDRYCRHCGAVLPAGSRFCLKCGTPVIPGAAPPPPPSGKRSSWWRRRSKLQKAGLIVAAVFVVLTILGATVGTQGQGGSGSSTTSTTLSQAAATDSENSASTTTAAPESATTAMATTTMSVASTTTSFPTGPAKVVASLSSPVPCEDEGNNTSQWDYTVTFSEENGVGATVLRIGERYIDKKGNVWIGENGEWSDDTISIDGNGSADYSSFVFSTNGGKGDLRGGTLQVSYTGTDANGNKFQGKVTATLAPSVTSTTAQ